METPEIEKAILRALAARVEVEASALLREGYRGGMEYAIRERIIPEMINRLFPEAQE